MQKVLKKKIHKQKIAKKKSDWVWFHQRQQTLKYVPIEKIVDQTCHRSPSKKFAAMPLHLVLSDVRHWHDVKPGLSNYLCGIGQYNIFLASATTAMIS